MKKIFLFVALIAIASVSAYSQSPVDFVKKACQVWGESKLDTAHTIRIESARIDPETSSESPALVLIKGEKMRGEFEREGQKYFLMYNGKNGWQKTPKGVLEIPSDQAKNAIPQVFQNTLSLARPLEGILKDSAKFVFDGQEVNGDKTLKIVKVTTEEGIVARYYFDANTAIFNKFEYTLVFPEPAPDGTKELVYKYGVIELGKNKSTLGYRVKVGEAFINGKKIGEFTIKSILMNEPIDDKLFEKPE